MNQAVYSLAGGKRGHKGGRRSFTDPTALREAKLKEEKEKEWRRQRGDLESESEEEEKDDEEKSDEESGSDDGGVAFDKAKSSEEESSEDEEEERKPKGAEALIEIENPNRVVQKQKKVTALETEGDASKPQLSRREREELEKQRAKAHYQKLHAAGKTEEARADLARLAIVRKQREEAAKKREEERKGKMVQIPSSFK